MKMSPLRKNLVLGVCAPDRDQSAQQSLYAQKICSRHLPLQGLMGDLHQKHHVVLAVQLAHLNLKLLVHLLHLKFVTVGLNINSSLSFA